MYVQWNSSNMDNIGTEESVLIREVSSFQGCGIRGGGGGGGGGDCPYFRGFVLEGCN